MATLRPGEIKAAGPRRRRRLIPIVDGAFQWKYTLIVVLLGAGTAGVMGGLWWRAHKANSRLLDLGDNARLQEQVAQADAQLLLYLLGLIVLMGGLLGVWALVVTHRISGPASMVARYCDVIANGHYPDVRPLRKRDELQKFFTAFCGAVASLRQRDLRALRELEAAVQAATVASESQDLQQLQRALAAAREALDAQRRVVAHMLGPGEGISVD